MSLAGDIEIASVHEADRTPVLGLIEDLARVDVRGRMSSRTAAAQILLLRDKALAHPEGYRLSVKRNRIVVLSGTDAGCYYGIQTLREMLRTHGNTIPCVEIDDEPRFSRRGYYLDCSRGKVPTVQTVRQLVEHLAHWKINELQLYIENVFTFASHPRIGEGFSPYSPSDIAAIREHCGLHHVRLVPSLTSLGHFEKILMLPEYQDLGELPGFRDLPGGTTLNPGDPRSLALLADMYAEFLPLFGTDDFNACGDEPWELGEGRSKERAAEVGVGRVYLDFILELRKLSLAHGKRMNLWGDIVLKHPEIIPDIPPDVVMLNWDYRPDGQRMLRTDEFAAAGLPIVCCPGTNGWQSHGSRLRTGMRDIHQFAGIAAENNAEGILNTDWGDGGHRNTLGASLHNAAYGAACSWNPAEAPGPEDEEFTKIFVLQTFGDSEGALADVITTIGDDGYGAWAYHALLESLADPRGFGEGFARARAVISDVPHSDDELRAKIEAAAALQTPGRLAGDSTAASLVDGSRPGVFEAIALQEYALANDMNAAAARRVLIARTIRNGGRPEESDLARNREELLATRAALATVWLARSRESRLADSLAGFDEAIAELDSLGA